MEHHNTPKVTVLLPVHNGEAYLEEAIESVLHQTFSDFELLIINDGSIDRTEEIICSLPDKRIRYLKNPACLGLVKTLNRGLREARGEYVARMDADDICVPERLALQVDYLDRHSEVGILGGQTIDFNERRRKQYLRYTGHDDITANLLFSTTLCHPTVMMRAAMVRQYHLWYDESALHCEDRELWTRASRQVRLANLDTVVLHYREHDQSVNSRYREVQRQHGKKVVRGLLESMGLNPSAAQLQLHWDFRPAAGIAADGFLKRHEAWLIGLLRQNRQKNFFNQNALVRVVHDRWFQLCRANNRGIPGRVVTYLFSPLARENMKKSVFNALRLVYWLVRKELKRKTTKRSSCF